MCNTEFGTHDWYNMGDQEPRDNQPCLCGRFLWSQRSAAAHDSWWFYTEKDAKDESGG